MLAKCELFQFGMQKGSAGQKRPPGQNTSTVLQTHSMLCDNVQLALSSVGGDWLTRFLLWAYCSWMCSPLRSFRTTNLNTRLHLTWLDCRWWYQLPYRFTTFNISCSITPAPMPTNGEDGSPDSFMYQSQSVPVCGYYTWIPGDFRAPHCRSLADS